MTCDNFKSNGFEEGDDEVAKEGVELFMLEIVVGVTVVVSPFDSNAGVEIEFFSCDFILDKDDEDFNVDGFAGTKKIILMLENYYFTLNFI